MFLTLYKVFSIIKNQKVKSHVGCIHSHFVFKNLGSEHLDAKWKNNYSFLALATDQILDQLCEKKLIS